MIVYVFAVPFIGGKRAMILSRRCSQLSCVDGLLIFLINTRNGIAASHTLIKHHITCATFSEAEPSGSWPPNNISMNAFNPLQFFFHEPALIFSSAGTYIAAWSILDLIIYPVVAVSIMLTNKPDHLSQPSRTTDDCSES